MNKLVAKILVTAAIILMGITALMNILGGAGTVCAAFLTELYPSMSALLPYRWLYKIIVIVTVGIGVIGIMLFIQLVRGRNSLIASRSSCWP